MKGLCFVSVAVLCLAMSGLAATAAPILHFDRDLYTVTPGEDLIIKVVLDGDSALAGDQPVAAGLMSAGFVVLFPAAAADGAGASVALVPELNSDGMDEPPYITTASGEVGAFGAVPFNVDTPYGGTHLATIRLKNLAIDSYPLSLDFYFRPPDSPFTNFVDFDINELDAGMQFGSARVNVVPEPTSFGLLVLGVCFGMRRRDRR